MGKGRILGILRLALVPQAGLTLLRKTEGEIVVTIYLRHYRIG
jgi:hypothetical protein